MRFADVTFPELRRVPRGRTLVLAPIAACEQHSRHLPVFTDTILCTAVGEGVEANSDLYASAEYRLHLARVHAARAIRAALSRAS